MSILDKIEEIQKKPRSYRFRVLILSSFFLTATIAVLWFGITFKNADAKLGQMASFGPFSLIKDNFQDIYEALRK